MNKKENNYERYGFKRSDIIDILGVDFFPMESENEKTLISRISHCDTEDKPDVLVAPIPHDSNIQWKDNFAGRKHALNIISVLSRKLAEKSGTKFLYGDKISANAIATFVISELNEKESKTQQYQKLIAQALRETAPTGETD